MKTKNKFLISIIAIFLSCAIIFTTLFVNFGTKDVGVASACVRTVDVSRLDVEAQSVFDEFENVELKTEGSKVSFAGTKQMDLSSLSDIDLIALDETFGINFKDVTYNLSIDAETSELELSLSFITENNEVITDTLMGIAITSETGKADALIFMDGETILLSELCGEDVLDNVGFFKWLWSAVKNIASKVINILSEPIKLIIIALEPAVELLGGVIEIVTLPFTAWKSDVNYNHNIAHTKLVVDKSTGYITNQSDSDYKSWYFGFGDIYNNGCGVIATYNALVFTNKIKNDKADVKDNNLDKYRVNCFANLIRSYELSAGTLIKGKLGTNPGAITPMLQSYGVNVATYSSTDGNLGFELACDHLGENQMAILCYWYSEPIGAHYTIITKSGNTYKFINNGGETSCKSVSAYLHSSQINNGFIKGWIVTK